MKKLDRATRERMLERLGELARKQNSIHVIRSDRGWAVTRAGAKRATRVLPNREDAIQLARSLAVRDSIELMVHGPDGAMITRECY